jgi:hypothetical protein
MKRLQIMIEEEIDEALGRLASTERVSKGALVRRYVRQGLGPLPRSGPDPIVAMSGVESFDPAPIDDVVYR